MRSSTVRPASIAHHRAPAPLSREALQLWLKGLSVFGASLTWEEGGFRLSWLQPHEPVIEASHIDLVRVNFEVLASLFKVKQLPNPAEESGSLEEDTPCYHAWRVTNHLRDLNQTYEEPTKQQTGLFEDAPILNNLPLCFGDCETTGFSPEANRICQLALVRVEPSGKTLAYTSYFNPEQKNMASSFNKISDWRLKTAPLLRNEISHFLPLLTGTIFVAHNASFDQRFLTKELSRQSLPWPALYTIDTMALSKAIWPKAPKHKLEVLAPWLGIYQGKVHDAMGDTETLMALWEAIRAERPELTLSQWARMAA